jgi:hypothetical protein
MEIRETDSVVCEDARLGQTCKRAYHSPELAAHGELTVLTQGFGDTGADGGFYTSLPN